MLGRLAQLYPDAAISVLWNDAPDRFAPGRATETWLARTPLRHHKALALPLMPTTWRHLGLSDADWILCSSHLFAHHARFSGPARHAPKYVYAYTPARYIWTPDLDTRGRNAALRIAARPFRTIDRRRAGEADSIAVVSQFVRDRVRKAWGRDATVIHPPVDIERFVDQDIVLTASEQQTIDSLPDTFLLGASRFVPYKRLDLVIEAGVATDVPVVLAGDGPQRPALEELAARHPGRVTFVRRPSHELLAMLYRRALAFVFPAVEDFGIMPLEAMATGTPVIGATIGGTRESVVHGETGFLIDSFDGDAVREAVANVGSLDPPLAERRARRFGPSAFDRRIREWIGA